MHILLFMIITSKIDLSSPNLYDKIRLEEGEELIDVEEILSKMNPNQKINYDRVMQKMVQVWGEKMSNGHLFSCMFAVLLVVPTP